jgi:hypothetical protein
MGTTVGVLVSVNLGKLAREPDAATHLPPQYNQLMPERCILCLKCAD